MLGSSTMSPMDLTIILGYLGLVLAWGMWLGQGQKTNADYFLGGRSIPAWIVLLSIVATETSTVTFLSIPGFTYAAENGDFRFLQIAFGYIAGRILVSGILLPLYFAGKPFTCYEVLEDRFGSISRRATSLLFLVTRNLSDALRLFLTALALQIATGFDMSSCVIALGVVTMIYTFSGGAKSVFWNDCLQFIIYMFGALVTLVVIVKQLPGGVEQILEYGRENNKLRLFDFDLSLTKPTMTFWAGLIGGAFLTGATHGTDQLMVQRYLSAKSQSSARWALILSGFIIFAQFALFLIIGLALACFYHSGATEVIFGDDEADRVFAHFIVHYLGRGLVGLTLAAVIAAAMSTLSSSLNSSATAFVNDLYLPLVKQNQEEQASLWISRLATIGFGILQMGIALAAQRLGVTESTVSLVLKIAGFALGPVLGLYLIGVLSKQVQQRAALLGFLTGLILLACLAFYTPLYWAWYAACGAIAVYLSGNLFHQLGLDSQTFSSEVE